MDRSESNLSLMQEFTQPNESVWSVLARIEQIIQGLASRIPFMNQNIVLNNTGGVVLDLGCETGLPFSLYLHQAQISYIIGLDIETYYLEKRNAHYDDLILADARFPPFRRKSVDTILGMQLLYHFYKRDAIRLLHLLFTIARKRIVITMPVGFTGQKWNKSVFYPHEMKNLGFRVTGHGFRLPQSIRKKHEFVKSSLGYYLVRLSFLFYFTYCFPSLSHLIVCVYRFD